jgi:sugar-specific transcriptional regulator TrmB
MRAEAVLPGPMASTLEQVAASLGSEISQEYRRAVGVLGKVGLTVYEARAYIALVARGVGDAATLAQTAGIPRTSAYKVLESLVEKGYATPTGGKPLLFHRVVADHGEPQLVYLLNGKEKVLGKIAELLDQSSRTFLLTTPQISDMRDELGKKVQSALKRGVQVTFVTLPLQRVPEGVLHLARSSLFATEVLADGEHALLAAPGLDACGFTDNPILTAHLKQFLDVILEKGSEPNAA